MSCWQPAAGMYWRALPHLDELEAGMKETEGW